MSRHAILLCHAIITQIDFGRDLEQQLNFYVDCRCVDAAADECDACCGIMSTSSTHDLPCMCFSPRSHRQAFTNLDPVIAELVVRVALLAMSAHKFMKGELNIT